jgi:UDP-N-acetylglucosamine 2-epimerase (non-hydrolysing)
VDDPATLRGLLGALAEIERRLPLVFPVHPRTQSRLEALEIGSSGGSRARYIAPLGYLEFVGLVAGSRLVLTDSGGLQEETTALGVPCLTLREQTERPVTVTEGTNCIVGTAPDRIVGEAARVLDRPPPRRPRPPLWDGHAAERIVSILRGGKQLTGARADGAHAR